MILSSWRLRVKDIAQGPSSGSFVVIWTQNLPLAQSLTNPPSHHFHLKKKKADADSITEAHAVQMEQLSCAEDTRLVGKACPSFPYHIPELYFNTIKSIHLLGELTSCLNISEKSLSYLVCSCGSSLKKVQLLFTFETVRSLWKR